MRQPNRILYWFIIFLLSTPLFLGCEGPEGPQGPQGEQGPQGPEGPQGPIGEEGNANVTRYILNGHDFSNDNYNPVAVPVESEDEMLNSAWLVYLVGEGPNDVIEEVYYLIPGYGEDGLTEYFVSHYHYPEQGTTVFSIYCDNSVSGENYHRIEILQIKANNTEDMTNKISGDIIPDHLDTSNYHDVVKYYNLD